VTELTIGIGSTYSRPGDVDANLAQIAEFAQRSAALGAHLLLTPEMSASGYGGYPEVLATAEGAGDGPIYRELARIAQENGLVVLAGFVELDAGHRYLAHYAVWPDGRFVVQRKHRVTPRESPLEPSVELYFDDTEEIGHVPAGASRFAVLPIGDARAAIVICADLGLRGLDDILAGLGVNLLLLPTAAGGTRQDAAAEADLRDPSRRADHIARAARHAFPADAVDSAVRLRRAFAAVNMTGFDGREFYHGGSGSIVDPSGNVEALLPGSPILERQRPRLAVGTVRIPSEGDRS
jgi:predicted amidohydrolase